MPNLKLFILSLMIQAMAAPAALAVSQRGADSVCDQAARRASQAEDVPLDVLYAIARVETGRLVDGRLTPWPWAINMEGKGYWFGSEVEAKSFVFDIFKAGVRSFDVGCFQINYRWHGTAFRSIDAMFDPDQNAAYAARFLKDLHTEYGTWADAVGAYHSRTPELAQGYVDRFQSILADLSGSSPPPDTPLSHDPFTRAAAPLIQSAQSQRSHGALGSLVPASGAFTAFIAFNQE